MTLPTMQHFSGWAGGWEQGLGECGLEGGREAGQGDQGPAGCGGEGGKDGAKWLEG